MNLRDDVEVIIVDDGSDPPLRKGSIEYLFGDLGGMNLTIHPTNDFRPWTQPIARNTGVRMAKGEYVMCTDVDHIFTQRAIREAYYCKYDVRRFKRQFGVLDEHGNFTQDIDELKRWGLPQERIDKRGLRIRPHSNSYIIRRDWFLEIGGSREDRIMFYPNRDEVPLKKKIKILTRRGRMSLDPDRSVIYMFPVGHFCGDVDYNPFGFFHDLKRHHYPKGAKLEDGEQLLQAEN
jgi:glycosyltransferase involved in cell wall biosynthesis